MLRHNTLTLWDLDRKQAEQTVRLTRESEGGEKIWWFKWKSTRSKSPNLQTTVILPQKKILLPQECNIIKSKKLWKWHKFADAKFMYQAADACALNMKKWLRFCAVNQCIGAKKRCRSSIYSAWMELCVVKSLNGNVHLDQVTTCVMVKEQEIWR